MEAEPKSSLEMRRGNRFVGGHCPPAPPAPALGEWGPCPIHLSWAWRLLYLRIFLEGDFVPLKLPLLKPQKGDILTLRKGGEILTLR